MLLISLEYRSVFLNLKPEVELFSLTFFLSGLRTGFQVFLLYFGSWLFDSEFVFTDCYGQDF